MKIENMFQILVVSSSYLNLLGKNFEFCNTNISEILKFRNPNFNHTFLVKYMKVVKFTEVKV